MTGKNVCLRVGLTVVMIGSLAFAQKRRDPLTQPEIDKIRDASWEPRDRLALYVEFARARLVKLEQMRSDPKTKDRAQQTHDLLDDFQLLYDELNDNIDTYTDRKDDIRKPLKMIIEADTEFQAKLRALKDAADVPRAEAMPMSSCSPTSSRPSTPRPGITATCSPSRKTPPSTRN